MNEFLEIEIKDLIRKVHELINAPSIPSRVTNENKCAVCGLRDKCYNSDFLQKRLRWALEQPKRH